MEWPGIRLARIASVSQCRGAPGGRLYWDILGIWSQILAGLRRYHAITSQTPQGIAVDGWGVDFGLVDRWAGWLPIPCITGTRGRWAFPEHVFEIIPEQEWFAATGVQTMAINTLFQLYSMAREHDPALEIAQTLLMVPDLCTYWLCGEAGGEWSEVATTQMYSIPSGSWATELLRGLDLPVELLPPITRPGTFVSPLRTEVLNEIGFAEPVPAIAVASHDTASAVAAIPYMDDTASFFPVGPGA